MGAHRGRRAFAEPIDSTSARSVCSAVVSPWLG